MLLQLAGVVRRSLRDRDCSVKKAAWPPFVFLVGAGVVECCGVLFG